MRARRNQDGLKGPIGAQERSGPAINGCLPAVIERLRNQTQAGFNSRGGKRDSMGGHLRFIDLNLSTVSNSNSGLYLNGQKNGLARIKIRIDQGAHGGVVVCKLRLLSSGNKCTII